MLADRLVGAWVEGQRQSTAGRQRLVLRKGHVALTIGTVQALLDRSAISLVRVKCAPFPGVSRTLERTTMSRTVE